MATHESTVNYRNLIRDLAEMYPQDVSEVVFIELVANSLDARADRIEVDFDAEKKLLVITDNGKGMDDSDFEQYHDFAAGLKKRGTGIGFAGVGAKISFNVAERVITETRSKSFSGASDWHFQSRKKLIWEDIQPKHLKAHGTRVEVQFQRSAEILYSSSEDIMSLIRRHYLPLVDREFLKLYDKMDRYSDKLRFVVNGKVVQPINVITAFNLEQVRAFLPKKRGKRIGRGIFGLSASEYPLGTEVSGVLICTHGKVIKSELFNQFPGSFGPRVFGLIEVPEFIKFLTTSKTDFIRRGKRRELESLLSPIRDEFKSWLAELGVQQADTEDSTEAAKLEKELNKLLNDVPELSEFFGFRMPKNILSRHDSGDVDASVTEGLQPTFPIGGGSKGSAMASADDGIEDGTGLTENKDVTDAVKTKPIGRTSKRGPRVAFDNVPDRVELSWVEGNSIIINSGHPCYIKTKPNATSRKLHNFYAIANAVQRFLVSDEHPADLMFIDRMMAVWGAE